MVIQHNIVALGAYNNWTKHSNRVSKALGRLSSGYRINSAADDAAGMAISQKMRAQLTQLNRERMNAMDAVSSLQVSEGAQSEVQSMLQRMQELATESMNGVLNDDDRSHLNEEYQQLLQEIDRINGQSNNSSISLFGDKGGTNGKEDILNKGLQGESITFSGNNLDAFLDALDGLLVDIATAAKDGDTEKLAALGVDNSLTNDRDKVQQAVTKFTQENAERLLNTEGGKQSATISLEGGNIKVKLLYQDTKDLGLEGTNISDAASAGKALEALKGANSKVSDQRAHYGAIVNRLEHSINFMSTMGENLEEAISRVEDADMAKEMTEFVRAQALEQVSMFVMTHANQQPSQILQLLNAV